MEKRVNSFFDRIIFYTIFLCVCSINMSFNIDSTWSRLDDTTIQDGTWFSLCSIGLERRICKDSYLSQITWQLWSNPRLQGHHKRSHPLTRWFLQTPLHFLRFRKTPRILDNDPFNFYRMMIVFGFIKHLLSNICNFLFKYTMQKIIFHFFYIFNPSFVQKILLQFATCKEEPIQRCFRLNRVAI